MTKKYLLLTLVMASQQSLACTICQDVGEYSTSVTESVADAGNSIVSTTKTIAQNYASTSKALLQSGDTIVSAINASSNSVTTEMVKSAEANARLMEALKESIEQLEKSKLIAENNKKAAETYGEENIPFELCEDFSRSAGRLDAHEIAKNLIDFNKKRQVEERQKEDRTLIVDPYVASAVNITSNTFTEVEAKIAMEQASIVSGEKSFPISPDVLMALSNEGGGQSDSATSMMSAWIRTSNASQEIASQIAKKTVPDEAPIGSGDKEPISIYGDLWKSIENSSNQEANIQDSSVTQANLQRSIARRSTVNNRIKMELLETMLATARINASQIGFLNESALSKIKESDLQKQTKASINRAKDGS